MEPIPLSMYIVLIILLILSAFFSSSETAFSSINKIRIRNYMEEKKRGAKKAHYIAENFDEAISAILIGNNIVNIAAATISANIVSSLLDGSSAIFVSTFVMTLLVLIFGEVLPKTYAKENAEKLAMRFSGPLYALIKVLKPVIWFLVKLKNIMYHFVSRGVQEPSVTEEELKVLVDISEEEGVIDDNERKLVHKALDFDEVTVGEALTPRIDMISINIEQSIEEIKEMFFEYKYSRIPVYENSTDNIIGILSERDFFSSLLRKGEANTNVRELLSDPLFIVGSMKLSTLLNELQLKKVHIAIVVDEFGGTDGLITMEDVLEELVGEIWDEDDEQIIEMRQIDETTYEFDGSFNIYDFAEYFGMDEAETNSHSLSGWLVEKLEKVPEKGDTLEYEHLVLIVEEIADRRIQKVKVFKNEIVEEENVN